MDHLIIEGTKSSPHVHFDADTGVLEIRGKSYPANAAQFYTPILGWVEEWLGKFTARQITLNLEMIYLNSSSSKAFLNLFSILDRHAESGQEVVINWGYHEEDETALECGKEFMEDLEAVNFNLVRITER